MSKNRSPSSCVACGVCGLWGARGGAEGRSKRGTTLEATVNVCGFEVEVALGLVWQDNGCQNVVRGKASSGRYCTRGF